MTKRRYDEHGTEFGNWLRIQEPLDSSLGFVATNIDYIWRNYNTGLWMLIEEKRHGGLVKDWQRQLFETVDKCCQTNPLYCGFHVLIFQNTNPDDGLMWWDKRAVTKVELLDILRFKRNEVERLKNGNSTSSTPASPE